MIAAAPFLFCIVGFAHLVQKHMENARGPLKKRGTASILCINLHQGVLEVVSEANRYICLSRGCSFTFGFA